jgi:hypothetical protein
VVVGLGGWVVVGAGGAVVVDWGGSVAAGALVAGEDLAVVDGAAL